MPCWNQDPYLWLHPILSALFSFLFFWKTFQLYRVLSVISHASRSEEASGFAGFCWLIGMKPCGLIIYNDCMLCTFHHICSDVHVAFVADLIHLFMSGLFFPFSFLFCQRNLLCQPGLTFPPCPLTFLSINLLSWKGQGYSCGSLSLFLRLHRDSEWNKGERLINGQIRKTN